MHSRYRKQLARAHAVAGFAARYPALTEPALGVEAQLTACLAQAAELEAREREAEADGITLAAARHEQATHLARGLELLHRFLHLVALTENLPELRVPTLRLRADAVGAFIRDARAQLHLASRHEALLIQYHMPVVMLKVLTGQVTEAEDLHRRRLAAAAVSGQVALELGRLLADIALLLRRLDALNRLRFLAAPERLIEWRAALALPRTLAEAPAAAALARITPLR